MARLVVDGMNVVGARPDGWWRDRTAAMKRLTAALDAYARETGDDVTVVFDGTPRPIPAEGVAVRFASRPGPNAADDDIAALVAATSDATLADRVAHAGGRAVGAGEFRRRLDAIAGEERGGGGRSSGS